MGTQPFAAGMAATAWLIGLALFWNRGFYGRMPLVILSIAILVCAGAILRQAAGARDRTPSRAWYWTVAGGLGVQAVLLSTTSPVVWGAVIVAGICGALQILDLRAWRTPVLTLGVTAFVVAAIVYIRVVVAAPPIDVFMFQQNGMTALLHGVNPYTAIYPNIYERDTMFYGPGVVDANNRLTIGLPYPPASLAMILPAFVIGGDCRYAEIAAAAATACLMAFVGGPRWGGLVAFLFLLTPIVFWIIPNAYTEPLFALTFSLVMVSALRWRRALPYALGLFAATKQYSLFSLPLTLMLLRTSDGWKEWLRLLAIAAAVAVAVTLPFVWWDPGMFVRSVVAFQFMQPFRPDSLSHLVWMFKLLPHVPFLAALPYAAMLTALAVVLWRPVRSAAYFAAAATLVQLVFFALSRQAFANYYYFTIATASWAAVAASPDRPPARHA